MTNRQTSESSKHVPQTLEEKLARITLLDDSQVEQLEAVVEHLGECAYTSSEIESLFRLFERFPESDGFGTFWGILHFLETCDSYETLLVQSVRRTPSEFGLLMVNRLMNSGVFRAGNHDLLDLLESVHQASDTSENMREIASGYLSYQRSKTKWGLKPQGQLL